MILAQRADQVADLDDLLGVKAHRGLVKNNNAGVADQRARNAHALAIALGKIADHAAAHVADMHHVAHLGEMCLAAQRAALEVIVEAEILVHSHVQVQRGLLGEVADLPLGIKGVVQNDNARHADAAGCAGEVAGENIHSGRFAGAVRAEEADDLALADLQADVIHSAVVAVILDQMFDFDHGWGSFLL